MMQLLDGPRRTYYRRRLRPRSRCARYCLEEGAQIAILEYDEAKVLGAEEGVRR